MHSFEVSLGYESVDRSTYRVKQNASLISGEITSKKKTNEGRF